MSDSIKEFRLEVLRLVLETGSGRIIDDPLERADTYLEWCSKEDKPKEVLSTKTATKQKSR